jgi:hypothetical protein
MTSAISVDLILPSLTELILDIFPIAFELVIRESKRTSVIMKSAVASIIFIDMVLLILESEV